MSLTILSLGCALQIALLGKITLNIRLVSTKFTENNINLYFYYDKQPTEKEITLSELVATKIKSDFNDISIQIHRFVLPEPIERPQDEDKINVFSRWEK